MAVKLTIRYVEQKNQSFHSRMRTWQLLSAPEQNKFISDLKEYVYYELEPKILMCGDRNKRKLEKLSKKWSDFLADFGERVPVSDISFTTKIDASSMSIAPRRDVPDSSVQHIEQWASKVKDRISHLTVEKKIDPQYSRPRTITSVSTEISEMIKSMRAR